MAKTKMIRLIESKIWQLSWANFERQYEMLLGEMILGKEFRETFCFARMNLNCAWTELWIEILRCFLPEKTIINQKK